MFRRLRTPASSRRSLRPLSLSWPRSACARLAAAHDDHDHAGQADPGRARLFARPLITKNSAVPPTGSPPAARCPARTSPLDDSAPCFHPGGQASKNITLLANLPKQGTFAATASFNSDIAFKGNYAFAGNYDGFTVYDISEPEAARRSSPGASAPARRTTSRSTATCCSCPPTPPAATTPATASPSPATEQGVVGGHQDLRHQRPADPAVHQVGRDRLRLAHPHAGAGQERARTVYVYVSSYSPERDVPGLPAAARHDLDREGPAEDARRRRAVVATPVLFPDGGNPGDPDRRTSATSGCHDITAYPEQGPRRRRLHG